MNKILILFFTLLVLINPSLALEKNGPDDSGVADFNPQKQSKSASGLVLEVENLKEGEKNIYNEFENIQSVRLKILNGEFKNDEIDVINHLTNNPMYDILVKKGDKVLLYIEDTGQKYDIFIADKKRDSAFYWLLGGFFALLVLVGGKKGFYSVVAIVITILLIMFMLIPLVVRGFSPIASTMLVAILSTVTTMFIVGGINYKSLSATIGTTLSLLLAGVLSILTVKVASLTGFSSQESMILFSTHPNLDFKGLLTSAIMIAALGAVMDVAMSISSCMSELKSHNESLTFFQLYTSGMNVGKDIIGTMSNTLILAYIGASLPLVLIASNIDFTKFMNLNSVITEFSSAVIGSIGIIACVPITALISAYFMSKYK